MSKLNSPDAVEFEEEEHHSDEKTGKFILLKTPDNTQINIFATTFRPDSPIRKITVSWINPDGNNGEVIFADWRNFGSEGKDDVDIYTRVPLNATDPENLRLWTESAGMSYQYSLNLINSGVREMADEEITYLDKQMKEGGFDPEFTRLGMDFLSNSGWVLREQRQIQPGPEIISPENLDKKAA